MTLEQFILTDSDPILSTQHSGMDSLDSGGPECSQLSNGTSGPPSAYVQVKDSYAELNGTRWHLVEAQGGYAPPMTIVSYLNSIHVTQTSSPGSPYGMRLNISVSLRVGEFQFCR